MDCYKILGVSRDANIRDINSAYKSLALKHHPDKTGGDDDDAILKFQRVQQAVEILRDPTARKAHDSKLPPPPSEEEQLFARPGYHGWVSTSLYVRDLSRSARYKYSYGNSVHMDPHSKESREEMKRCARVLEEEEMERRERARKEEERREWKRNMDNLTRSWKDMQTNWDAEDDNKKPGAGPGAYPSDSSESNLQRIEEEDTVEAEWWAGAKPRGMHDAEFEGGSDVSSELAGRTGEEVEVKAELGDEVRLGNTTDARRDNYGAEFSPDVESELGPNIGFKSDQDGDAKGAGCSADAFGPDAYGVLDSESSLKSVSEDGSMVNLGLGPEYHAAFYIKTVITEPEAKAEVETDGSTTVGSIRTGHAIFDTNSPEKIATDYHTASPGSLPDLAPSPYLMSGGLGNLEVESPANLDKTFVTQTEYGSDSSVYYEFSEPASPAPENTGNQALKPPPTLQTYDHKFNATNVYPHLRPFIPYFAAKLAHKDGRYTKDDFQAELRGMIMETYCGWLETVRVTIPGAESLKATLDLVPQDCLHLGYWEKEFGSDECEKCHLWRPIYTLVCPGCEIKKCVGCKFGDCGA
ncbi:hypothetical protein BJY01DRAFT_246079 [Aspergillus pseudoustus]|uniref:J domain-containing protein n=1 Tax=Aspergillus pseudoustus TaxID=1810923 RepID=A0ABR4KD69_9EURO